MRYLLSAIRYPLILATAAICAAAPLRPCAAQSDPRLVAAVHLAQEGQGDSARLIVKRIIDATPAANPLYAEALFAAGMVAATTVERERQFQRLVVEFNGSAWSDDALLQLMQLNFARGDLSGVVRTAERLAGDYPQSEVIPDAALWAARAYFRQDSTAAGCRWLANGLARADTLNVELRNGLTFLNGRCGVAADTTQGRSGGAAPTPAPTPTQSQAPAVTAPTPPKDTVTRPARGNECADNCWTIQVASSRTRALANDLVARLARDGFPGARVEQDGTAFKVRVGNLSTRAEVDALLARVRAKYPQAFVVGGRP
ncbi:MAG: SPOR domain-containing protein [Gemmatimonadetes bacterium]|nr:SPOR domain-containing protein [Gemmatimonadota bacterium]